MDREREAVELFGQFLMEHLRDRAIKNFEDKLQGKLQPSPWLAPPPYILKQQAVLATLSAEQQEAVRQCVYQAIDGGIHDFLFQVEEAGANGIGGTGEHDLQILVNGVALAGVTDGLHGLLFENDGWQAMYSAFKNYDYLIMNERGARSNPPEGQ